MPYNHHSISLNTITIRTTPLVHLWLVIILTLVLLLPATEVKSLKVSGISEEKSSSATASSEGQRFAMEPQDQTAVVGSRVTLPCRVMGKIGALQWTKDDFGLGQHRNLSGFERYSMVGSDEEGDFSLDIYPVMLDDDAKYQCQVGPGPLGEPGIRSRFAKLTILVPPEAPKILQGDYLVTTEDREIELECVSVGGKPAAEITWIDGLGNVLSNGIEYVKEPLADSRRSTAKSILKLAPKKEHHNTTFTCQAQNTADRTYRSAKLLLEVKYAPKVTVSVVGGSLAGGRIPEGAEVILSCQADANPKELSYKWFINDELVTGDYTTKMIIHNISRQYHDAIVKCEVLNAVGKSEESETLDISYGPVFKHRPESVEADIGSTVNLRCEVDGNPPPEIEWINENSERVVGTSSNLTLKVNSDSAGRYYCKANVLGFPEIGAEATVYVKRAPMITSHKIQFGSIGNRVKVDCLAFSVPKSDNILWLFEGHPINVSLDDTYTLEEQHFPEGVKASLIIRDSQSSQYGKYNCTVINSYGSDSIVITLIPERSIPYFLVVMGSVSSVAIILMVAMLIVVYLKRSKKKPLPADVIPEGRVNDKLNDMKTDIRSAGYDVDYSETCSGSESLAINLTSAPMPDIATKGGTLGVPLAGPVKLSNEDRFSGEFSDRYNRCMVKNQKNQDIKDNNGYAPYFEYALDYSPPTDSISKSASNTLTTSTTLPHYNNPISSGNMSLPRSRNEPQYVQSAMQNGFLGQPLLQNGLAIDSRFSAIYGNPYLRTSSTILPPLPPPSTANPAATPAPPPYHAPRNHPSSISGSTAATSLKNFGPSAIGIGSIGSNSNSNLTASSNTLHSIAPLTTTQSPSQVLNQSPSGQFILPSNGNTKKGALATHV
ncbi:irregular chiasm C-roughest protein [Eupeodes corollae]|uniref:irregular chiasm C-roughest protein n=1 Tax=Eupeodes corollae TaxID=290404 RepID=UPI0024906CBC|nr:irregular chiasm C-roughest protein [Eupeodes corollae]